MEIVNQVRGYHFLLGVFRNQHRDPYCSVCSAYANTLTAARENLVRLEAEHADALKGLAPDLGQVLADTRAGLVLLQDPAEPSGQKKAGKCKLPQGTCFIKASFSLIQQI